MKKILTFGVIGFLVVAAFALVMTLNAKEANACIPGVNCGGSPCSGTGGASDWDSCSVAKNNAKMAAFDSANGDCSGGQVCVGTAVAHGCDWNFGWNAWATVEGTCGSY